MPLSYEPENPLVRFWTETSVPPRAHLDVRELLIEGGEPYAVIMECVHGMDAGDVLVLHAIMQPRPLLAQLSRMGFVTEARHVGEDHWEVEIGKPLPS